MKEEKIKFIKLILHAITSFGTIGIIISVCITYYGIKQNTEWNRRVKTVELVGNFEEQIAKYRPAMQMYFPFLYFKGNKKVLDAEVAEKLWRLTIDKSGNYEFLKDSIKLVSTRNQIVGLLNYLEYLSQAYMEHTVDQEIFESSLADAIILYHHYFETFITASQNELGYPNWQPVTNLVNYVNEKRLVHPTPPKPGP